MEDKRMEKKRGPGIEKCRPLAGDRQTAQRSCSEIPDGILTQGEENTMFDKFGEMNSYTEINELAANLLQEGDLDSLKELAKENGIPDDYVEMYLEEAIPSLCDSTSAAIGKIDVECMKLKPKELMLDWVEYIKGLCMENEMIAHQVRKKGKTLQGCMAVLLEYSFKNQITVDKAIIKAAGVSAGKVTFGVPGMAKAKELIRDYYMGGAKA